MHAETPQEPAFIHILQADPLRMKPSTEKLRQRQAEEQRKKPIAFDWESLTGWPTDPDELRELRKILDLDIEHQFRLSLPRDLHDSFDASGETPLEVGEQFDKFLVSQAQVIGARLMLSDLVMVRVLKWSLGAKDGLHYLEKFTKAVVQSAKLRFDVDKARGDVGGEDWHQAKIETTDELAALQKEIMRNNAKRHRTPGLEEIKTTILRNAEMYSSLRGNLTSFLEFCKQHAPTFTGFAEGSIRPAPFFDELAGWATNRDPESVRQKIAGRK